MIAPAICAVGCTVKASWLPGPAVMVNAVLSDEVRVPEAASS
jgi:hypothetical protein